MFKQAFKNNNTPLNGLQNIQQNLNQQRQLLRVIKASLPDNLIDHCLHVTSGKGGVILFTDSSVWASKLLYMRQAILNTLSKHVGERVHSLKVKVLRQQIQLNQKRPKSPSSHALNILSESNRAEPTDKLSHSMIKLITALKKNKLLD